MFGPRVTPSAASTRRYSGPVDKVIMHLPRNYSAIYLDIRNLNEQITLGVDYLLNKLHQTIEFAYEP